MTHQLFSAPRHGVASSTPCSVLAFQRRRFRLAARWQRVVDGHLECRWRQQLA